MVYYGKKCWKCKTKKNLTKHHVFGKYGLCGLTYDATQPLMVLLSWLEYEYDDLDLMYWNKEKIPLCRHCHDNFHILFTKILNRCDEMESELPLWEFIGSKSYYLL